MPGVGPARRGRTGAAPAIRHADKGVAPRGRNKSVRTRGQYWKSVADGPPGVDADACMLK